jgi:hypothetical protein
MDSSRACRLTSLPLGIHLHFYSAEGSNEDRPNRASDGKRSAAALRRNGAAALDRRKVRRRFEERFTAHRMASDYVRIYRKLVHHAVGRPRVKYQTNGGVRISEEELISDVNIHAD